MIEVGKGLPDAVLLHMGANGPETVNLSERLAGRRVAIFAVPGAFTPTCDSAHLPSFIRNMQGFIDKRVDEVICLSANDAYVMDYWGRHSGAIAAGITMLADHDGAFARATGMEYSSPKSGMLNRSRRYAMMVDNGIVTVFHPETGTGVCDISGGEALLAAI